MAKPGIEHRILYFCCLFNRILRGFRLSNNIFSGPRVPKTLYFTCFLSLPHKVDFDTYFTLKIGLAEVDVSENTMPDG